MTIGDRIKKARIERNLTQKELADRLGVSYVVISQWENGKRNPKESTKARIAAALGISPLYFAEPVVYDSPEEFLRAREEALQRAGGSGGNDLKVSVGPDRIQVEDRQQQRLNAIYEELDQEDASQLVKYGELLLNQDKYKTPPQDEPGAAENGIE